MALIPPFFLDCIVAIGLVADDGSHQWKASGFLYGSFIEDRPQTEKSYHVFLVTNRHVVERLEMSNAIDAEEHTMETYHGN